MSEETSNKAYEAIVSFVNDLWEVFGSTKTKSSLMLYHRLIERNNSADEQFIEKVVSGFTLFLTLYEQNILKNELDKIPKGTVIDFGASKVIKLEIQKYIHQSDEEIREAIRQHLITISALLKPSQEKLEQLRNIRNKQLENIKIDTNSKEGEFINNIMQKAKMNMESVDTDNPAAAIMGLFQGGLINDMMSGLKNGVDNGEMDMSKLLTTMQSAIGNLMPTPQNPKVEEIDNEPKTD